MKPQKTARFMRSNQTMSTQAIYDVVEILQVSMEKVHWSDNWLFLFE